MPDINFYPKFARNVVFMLFAALAASTLILLVNQKFYALPREVTSTAAVVWFFLIIPLGPTVQYIFSIEEGKAGKVAFHADDDLRARVAPLLRELDYEVRVGYHQSPDANAFAISSIFRRYALITFSTGLLAVLDEKQFLAVAAHEVAHIKHGDARNKAYILAFDHALRVYPRILKELHQRGAGIFVAVVFGFFVIVPAGFVALFSGASKGFALAWALFSTLAPYGLALCACALGFMGLDYLLKRFFFAYSREREFAADAGAAAMTSPEAMISVLGMFAESDGSISIFDTHPPMAERMARLSGNS